MNLNLVNLDEILLFFFFVVERKIFKNRSQMRLVESFVLSNEKKKY